MTAGREPQGEGERRRAAEGRAGVDDTAERPEVYPGDRRALVARHLAARAVAGDAHGGLVEQGHEVEERRLGRVGCERGEDDARPIGHETAHDAVVVDEIREQTRGVVAQVPEQGLGLRRAVDDEVRPRSLELCDEALVGIVRGTLGPDVKGARPRRARGEELDYREVREDRQRVLGPELRVDVREQVGERSRVGCGEPHGAGVRPHGRVVLAAEVAVNADGYGEGGERARCREDERRTARPSGHPVDDQCGEERDREGNRGEMVPVVRQIEGRERSRAEEHDEQRATPPARGLRRRRLAEPAGGRRQRAEHHERRGKDERALHGSVDQPRLLEDAAPDQGIPVERPDDRRRVPEERGAKDGILRQEGAERRHRLVAPRADAAAAAGERREDRLLDERAEGILRGEEGDHAENDEARSDRKPDHARAPRRALGDERRGDQHREQGGGAEVLTRDEAETTHRAGDGHESGARPPEADEQEGEGEGHQESAAARVVESVPDREGEHAQRDEPEAGQERRPARHRSPRDQVEEPGHRGGQHGDREPRGCERGPGRAQQAGEQVEDARPGVGHDDVPVEDLAPVDLRRRLQDAALVGVIHPAERDRELEGEGERGQRQGERGVASHRVATAATLSPTGRRSRRRSAASTR